MIQPQQPITIIEEARTLIDIKWRIAEPVTVIQLPEGWKVKVWVDGGEKTIDEAGFTLVKGKKTYTDDNIPDSVRIHLNVYDEKGKTVYFRSWFVETGKMKTPVSRAVFYTIVYAANIIVMGFAVTSLILVFRNMPGAALNAVIAALLLSSLFMIPVLVKYVASEGARMGVVPGTVAPGSLKPEEYIDRLVYYLSSKMYSKGTEMTAMGSGAVGSYIVLMLAVKTAGKFGGPLGKIVGIGEAIAKTFERPLNLMFVVGVIVTVAGIILQIAAALLPILVSILFVVVVFHFASSFIQSIASMNIAQMARPLIMFGMIMISIVLYAAVFETVDKLPEAVSLKMCIPHTSLCIPVPLGHMIVATVSSIIEIAVLSIIMNRLISMVISLFQ